MKYLDAWVWWKVTSWPTFVTTCRHSNYFETIFAWIRWLKFPDNSRCIPKKSREVPFKRATLLANFYPELCLLKKNWPLNHFMFFISQSDTTIGLIRFYFLMDKLFNVIISSFIHACRFIEIEKNVSNLKFENQMYCIEAIGLEQLSDAYRW